MSLFPLSRDFFWNEFYCRLTAFQATIFILIEFLIEMQTDESAASTNDDATSCKRYAVSLGYWSDPFINLFCKQPSRKTPEINRGYFARTFAVQKLVQAYIKVVRWYCCHSCATLTLVCTQVKSSWVLGRAWMWDVTHTRPRYELIVFTFLIHSLMVIIVKNGQWATTEVRFCFCGIIGLIDLPKTDDDFLGIIARYDDQTKQQFSPFH